MIRTIYIFFNNYREPFTDVRVRQALNYAVDNQAIVIPETIDAIRALTGIVENAEMSIKKTNKSLGIA